MSIKKIIRSISDKLFSHYRSDYVLSVAAINATIMSILIALSSAYILQINSQMNEIENDAIGIAEKVNDIRFSSIWFKLVSPAGKFSELWVADSDQLQMRLSNYFRLDDQIVEEHFPYKSPPTEIYFKDFGLNHTEFKLCLIGALALKYPFPDRLVITDSRFHGLAPNPSMVFMNKKDLEKWSSTVKENFEAIVMDIKWFGPVQFIKGFNWKNEIDMANKFFDKTDFSYSPESIEKLKIVPEEFISNVLSLNKISQNVNQKLNRIRYLERLLPSKGISISLLIWAIFSFFSGAIAPLYTQSIGKFWILWVPTCFYLCFFSYLLFKVFTVSI